MPACIMFVFYIMYCVLVSDLISSSLVTMSEENHSLDILTFTRIMKGSGLLCRITWVEVNFRFCLDAEGGGLLLTQTIFFD